ncbi:anti-sigma factor [Actinoplanes sp. NEAU-A12]|uniref:Anti-sigma factor n=1 Tax=Actinoplanes sandaracinus TaxID=3045177 RepID=A0ABT6WIN3_9ACTN|nr:anti-sigma factor [Actinoplanes sandaracinus]MDI6099584.1 anti-sigma factor [Actinoplanes sandaracinus]
MQHLDPDRLVLLALSEQQQELSESDHLAQCAGCRYDLDSLREVADIGTEIEEVRDLPAPPESVWRAIEAGITTPVAPVTPLAGRRGRPQRERRRWLAPVLSAAAAAIVAVAGTVVAFGVLDRPPAETVTAQATLAPLPKVPVGAGGTAEVTSSGKIRIDARNLPLTPGFHEVWLIDPGDLTKMLSLGNLPAGASVELPVPPGTDLNRYRLVDISDEPHDGDATHSGQSLLRGTLTS